MFPQRKNTNTLTQNIYYTLAGVILCGGARTYFITARADLQKVTLHLGIAAMWKLGNS